MGARPRVGRAQSRAGYSTCRVSCSWMAGMREVSALLASAVAVLCLFLASAAAAAAMSRRLASLRRRTRLLSLSVRSTANSKPTNRTIATARRSTGIFRLIVWVTVRIPSKAGAHRIFQTVLMPLTRASAALWLLRCSLRRPSAPGARGEVGHPVERAGWPDFRLNTDMPGLRKLIGLAIDGGTDAQSRFRPHMAKISIPTGTTQATDFDRMDKTVIETLIENGARAATSFIKQELLAAQGGVSKTKSLFDEHQAFLRLTEHSTSARNLVVVSFPDTKWFWELFPTAFYWLRHGVQIHCFTAPPNDSSADSAKEDQRRHIMTRMGVLLYEQTGVPFRGFLIDNGREPTASALLFAENHFDYEPVAQYYEARTDVTFLAALYDKVRPLLRPATQSEPLVVEPAPLSELVDLLKTNVRQYRNSNVRIGMETIAISNIRLISRYVRAFRYRQIGTLVEAYGQSNLELFQPARIALAAGEFSIVTPPVFEAVDDQYVALEGNTRSLYCLNNGIATIKALVVRGTNEALPGIPVPLRQVRITSSRYRPDEMIQGFNRSEARRVERAVRPLVQGGNAA